MYKALFIGSNPSSSANTPIPFCPSTKSGLTLRQWAADMGLTEYNFLNISNTPTPNNRPLTNKEILANQDRLRSDISDFGPARMVAVGKSAAQALTLLHIPFYEMPHPSGLNRQLNDPKYLEEKINGLRIYLSPFKIES